MYINPKEKPFHQQPNPAPGKAEAPQAQMGVADCIHKANDAMQSADKKACSGSVTKIAAFGKNIPRKENGRQPKPPPILDIKQV
jgi:hypothetical protein